MRNAPKSSGKKTTGQPNLCQSSLTHSSPRTPLSVFRSTAAARSPPKLREADRAISVSPSPTQASWMNSQLLASEVLAPFKVVSLPNVIKAEASNRSLKNLHRKADGSTEMTKRRKKTESLKGNCID